jgi:hypothetical protein
MPASLFDGSVKQYAHKSDFLMPDELTFGVYTVADNAMC